VLSLSAAKAHLRVTTDTEDALIARLCDAALEHLERKTGLYLGAPGERSDTLAGSGTTALWLPNAPVSGHAVTVLELTSDEDEGTAVEAATYRVSGRKLERLWGNVWTAGYLYRVTHMAGYASDQGPRDLVQAQAMLVAHWFENREAVVTGTISAEVEHGVSALVGPYVPLPI
jgi:uncharacterized phiE125 gp8 family phage protein